MNALVDKLATERMLTREEFKQLLVWDEPDLHTRACEIKHKVYGNQIYLRGLIEFTNFCKQNCLYCGIRCDNTQVERYRLTKEEILACCQTGYGLDFRTFVLQGGEDPYFTDDLLAEIIREIKDTYPDCAITLSVGERRYESYKRLFHAGADRYLLRHETANARLYHSLHPPSMSLERRKQCLYDLKEIGYQVGCGFLVGAPGQTLDHIVDDFLFVKELNPEMVGIGPFIPHGATPFALEKAGSLDLVLNALAILRLMLPNLLMPATTALGSIDKRGRELGVLAGANVVMPNLSPLDVRRKYLLYDDKICVDDAPKHCRGCISRRMQSVGHEIVVTRGDYIA